MVTRGATKKPQDSIPGGRRKWFVVARVFALCFVIASALADNSGARSAAFYFLLAAVPAIGMGGLMALGELVDACTLTAKAFGATQALFSFVALALAMIVVGSSSGSLFDVIAPGISLPALAVCLAMLALQAALVPTGNLLRRAPALYARAGEDFATAEHVRI